MVDSQEGSTVGKCSLCWLIILSGLGSACAVILVVLLESWGNTGLVGSGSMVVGTCPNAYLTAKYANLSTINSAIFVCSCVAAFTSSVLLLVFLGWVCKTCSKGLRPSACTKESLFFLVALTILAAVPPLGYYLSFLLQLSQCSNNTIDATNTFVAMFLAAGLLLFAFVVLNLVLCQDYSSESREDKYRQVGSNQTEPNEQARQKERNKDTTKEEKKSPVIVKEEYTKQNIHVSREIAYQSPQKKRIQDPNIYLQPKGKEQLRSNFLVPPRVQNRTIAQQQILTQNLHPSLRNINTRPYAQKSSPSKYQLQDDGSFSRQVRRYYDNDRRGILTRGDFEERDRRERDPRPYDDRRNRYDERERNERSSPQRRDRGDYYPPERRGREDQPWREQDYRKERESPFGNRYSPPNREREREGILRNYGRYRN